MASNHHARVAPPAPGSLQASPRQGEAFARPTFSLPVTAALTFTVANQAAEVAALQRLASPGGWLLRRPEVRHG